MLSAWRCWLIYAIIDGRVVVFVVVVVLMMVEVGVDGIRSRIK